MQAKVWFVQLCFFFRLRLIIEFSEHMMYLNALGQPVIVLNSLKVAFELLDRRANLYSDRPQLIVANEILSGSLFTAFLPYGDVFVSFFSI